MRLKMLLPVIGICACLTALVGCGDDESDSSSSNAVRQEGITLEEYEELQLGMDTLEIIDIVGTDGTTISESEEDGIKTEVLEIPGETSGKATLVIEYDTHSLEVFGSLKSKSQEDLE